MRVPHKAGEDFRHESAQRLLLVRLADLALIAAEHIRNSADLELVTPPQFGAVVFRFRPGMAGAKQVNERIPHVLFHEGRAVVGHTTVRGEPALKLTLCNPATEECQVRELLDTITACGRRMIDGRQSQNNDRITCDLSTPCLG